MVHKGTRYMLTVLYLWHWFRSVRIKSYYNAISAAS